MSDSKSEVVRFSPHPVLVVFAILIVVGAIALGVATARKDGLESTAISYMIGSAIGAAFWPFLLGWGVFLAFKRSNRAGNITILIMLLLSLLSFGADAVRGQRKSALFQEAKSMSAQAKEANEKGDTDQAIALTNRAAGKLEEAAKLAPANEKVAAEYGASISKRLAGFMAAYMKALGEFSKAGGESCAGLTDEPAVAARISLLDDTLAKHDEVLAYLGGLEAEMPQELAARGLSKDQIAAFLREFGKGAKIAKMQQVHEMEHAILEIMAERLGILRVNMGRWSCSEGAVSVDSQFPEAELNRFNELSEQMAKVSADQQALLTELQSK